MRRMRSWGRYYALLTLLAIAGCQQDPGPPPELTVIDTFPATGSSQNDTFLTLIDTAGTILAQDDNGFPNQATYVGYSRIEVIGGLAAGTYYIKVHKPTEVGNPNYGIRVHAYDPGETFPVVAGANEDETVPVDDAVDGMACPPLRIRSPWMGWSAGASSPSSPTSTGTS